MIVKQYPLYCFAVQWVFLRAAAGNGEVGMKNGAAGVFLLRMICNIGISGERTAHPKAVFRYALLADALRVFFMGYLQWGFEPRRRTAVKKSRRFKRQLFMLYVTGCFVQAV